MNLTTILEQSNLDVVERKSIAEKFSDYESIAKEWVQYNNNAHAQYIY